MRALSLVLLPAIALAACGQPSEPVEAANGAAPPAAMVEDGRPFAVAEVGQFDEPWAMTFLPNGILLITEKKGNIRFIDFMGGGQQQRLGSISGVPQVDHGGQGGLGDIVPHPDFRNNSLIYLSYAEAGPNDTRGAVVARARLVLDQADEGRLENLQVIWRQDPKVTGRGHYAHKLAFSPDGRYLFISSGDRQKFDPAQDMNANLGKILRVTDAGGIPSDNPWYDQGGAVRGAIWSLGHRNPLGLAFAPDGRLWSHEMGPAGGDEMNLIERGSNYGYPIVSNGDHYDGRPIPDHDTQPQFNAPEITWTPVISPSSMIFYTGSLFPEWRGNALIGALSGEALVRVAISGNSAREVARYPMGQRIREVEQGPDGAVYVLEDERGGSGGKLLRLTPAR
ncbi:MAG TPA: PQQ-dependent sugar dehydrogenase [Allosphingosinicella sp.]|uniref:PQQ-dependent sugar dehydrogenase n=1 Tax=Allosphingosinicella sp. TaxID=2823234 RepID=UPI002EDB422F